MKRIAILSAVVLFAACAPKGEETVPADAAAVADSIRLDSIARDSVMRDSLARDTAATKM
jgi:hypothetical protein